MVYHNCNLLMSAHAKMRSNIQMFLIRQGMIMIVLFSDTLPQLYREILYLQYSHACTVPLSAVQTISYFGQVLSTVDLALYVAQKPGYEHVLMFLMRSRCDVVPRCRDDWTPTRTSTGTFDGESFSLEVCQMPLSFFHHFLSSNASNYFLQTHLPLHINVATYSFCLCTTTTSIEHAYAASNSRAEIATRKEGA